MRATQFVRRGLVAVAAIGTLTFGLSGVASAQQPAAFPGTSPGAVIDAGTAVIYNPITGYTYQIVHTDGDPTAVLAVATLGGTNPNGVVVEFLPDLGSAAIITPGTDADIILP